MTSPPVEAMRQIFWHAPELFGRLAPMLGIAVPEITEVTVLPASFDTLSPVGCGQSTQLRLETVGQAALVLLIEAQARRDPHKPAHWAHHVSYLWTRHQLPTALLIMCPDQDTARWAAQPVSSGSAQPPALTLHPFVAGPHNVPLITDLAEVRADPALATLSILMHPTDPRIGTALDALSTALRDVPDALSHPLTDLTAVGVRDHPAKHVWEALVKATVLEELQAAGRIELLAQYRTEHLLLLLRERGLVLPVEMRTTITDCHDPDLLHHWLLRAVSASCAEEIFDDERP